MSSPGSWAECHALLSKAESDLGLERGGKDAGRAPLQHAGTLHTLDQLRGLLRGLEADTNRSTRMWLEEQSELAEVRRDLEQAERRIADLEDDARERAELGDLE